MPLDPPGDGAREIADSVLGYLDSDDAPDGTRADALALAFVDVAERVFPGGLQRGGTTGVDFVRGGVAVRVVAMEVPAEGLPAWVPWPTHQGPWWMRWKTSGATQPVVAWDRGTSFCVEVTGKEEEFFPGSFTAEVEFTPAVPPVA